LPDIESLTAKSSGFIGDAMQTFFFYVSKIIWALISPGSLIVLLSVVGLLLLKKKAYQKAAVLFSLLTIGIFFVSLFPIGDWTVYPLEKRFPPVEKLSEPIDGIIVLGGPELILQSRAWRQAELNQHSERFFAFVELARKFPNAKLVYTGGSGDPLYQKYKGSEVARQVFEEQGLDLSRVIFESKSRNTYENALLTRKMVLPRPGEKWVLITSAAHMPRSVGIFTKIGWKVIPYPVDHDTNPETLFQIGWDFTHHLYVLENGLREWTGLLAYYLTGKTACLFPGPAGLKD
jgi:uncharacterized SAM-binding protein YcdF (DUF218 family)